ncbi:MAG TPA: hypothetical protein VG497_22350 [Kribbella sp.]|nr:hypothetical protein [Kribbella sp.]
MTVMGERLPEAWIVEWHHNRRVEFPLRRWSFLQFPFLLLVAPSGLMLSSVPDMLARGASRYLAYLVIATYAGLVIAIAWQLITQRPYLVVDRTGIHQGRRSMPWPEVGSIGLIRGPGPIRQLPIHPKNVWARDLILSRQHVNDLPTFRTWLEEILEEQRRAEPAQDSNAADR